MFEAMSGFASARRAGRVVTLAVAALLTAASTASSADDAYRPPNQDGYSSGDAYRAPPPASAETYEPYRPLDGSRRDGRQPGPTRDNAAGYGEPYAPPSSVGENGREERYEPVAPEGQGGPPEAQDSRGYYTQNEILRAGHGFFGEVSTGLASAVEWAFQKAGRPNGYILGQDAGGAVVAGVRYGEGKLHTKEAGDHKVFWQGPSVGYDFGAEGSKVMVLVYNMHDPSDIYNRFAGVQGAAYVVGGVGVELQKAGDVTLAPIRAGVGLRLGANVGYLKYTRNPTWNPF